MKRVLALILAFSVAGVDPVPAQDRASAPCMIEYLEGVLVHGTVYRATFGGGLLLQLTPATHPNNPQGWTLQVFPYEGSTDDYAAVATPPYRFSNPRYIDTGYGMSAEQAVQWKERDFRFVLNAVDFKGMQSSLGTVLWPGEHSPEEVASAMDAMAETPTGSGTLHILSAEIRSPMPDFPAGLIERLMFRADLCIPVGSDAGGR